MASIIRIIDANRCNEPCSGKNCIYICPVGLFTLSGSGIIFHQEGPCLECGACRLVCDNITFDYPPAGEGVLHRYG